MRSSKVYRVKIGKHYFLNIGFFKKTTVSGVDTVRKLLTYPDNIIKPEMFSITLFTLKSGFKFFRK